MKVQLPKDVTGVSFEGIALALDEDNAVETSDRVAAHLIQAFGATEFKEQPSAKELKRLAAEKAAADKAAAEKAAAGGAT